MSATKTKSILNKAAVLADYKLAQESRQASLMGRKEVFMGKAKFGIFGDGKEVAQIAMAKAFQKGDFRSGYYRDQTFMFAIGELTVQQYFAQLYAHTSVTDEPASAGRLMNGHFGTRYLDDHGNWKAQTAQKNSTSDVSPTASQMPRLVGLAYASKLYRNNPKLKDLKDFSIKGNEVAWGTIGNASTSEGMFFEAVNAGGVLQVPMVVSVWDDEYGISVPKEYHTTKGSISEILKGFQRNKEQKGYEIIVVNGWDYLALVEAYQKAAKIAREEHVPVLVHVVQLTQPQGHSTSGSHERYKSKERLAWEAEYDCVEQMKAWIIREGMATEEELDAVEQQAAKNAKDAKDAAWKAFVGEIKAEQKEAVALIQAVAAESNRKEAIEEIATKLAGEMNPIRKDVISAVRQVIRLLRFETGSAKTALVAWYEAQQEKNFDRYNSYLYSQSEQSALKVAEVKPVFDEDAKQVDGREVLQACFDAALSRDPRVFAFGEDVGKIGDVNQAFAGLQEKHGELRVTDTGIRECTILGQGIGAGDERS